MLPSFWAGETLFASLIGGCDLLHGGALWTTACAFTVILSAASERWYFRRLQQVAGGAQGAVHELRVLDRRALLPLPIVRRNLLIKDLKVFLRDVTQWSQLLLLLALMVMYLYNFRVLDLDRIPYMAGRDQEYLRIPESRPCRFRDGDRCRAFCVSGVSLKARPSGLSGPRPSRCAISFGRNSGRGWCRCWFSV